MGERQIIAIDIDDVLSDTVSGIINFCNKTYGTNLKLADYNEDIAKMCKIDRYEAKKRVIKFHTSGAVAELPHVESAKPVLKRLSKHYRLILLTSRRQIARSHTVQWVNRYFKDIFSDTDIYFSGFYDKDHAGSVDMTKGFLASSLGVDYLIDDQPKHCISADKHGITALLFGDYEWNKYGDLPKSVVRVVDWQAVEEYFDERV